MLDESLAEALKQMGFAQAAVAVDEERVVLRAGKFRDVEGGVVGELIARADDEGLDVVAQARARGKAGGHLLAG